MIKQLALLSLALLYCCIAKSANADTTTLAQGFGLKVYTGVLQYHHKEMEILRRNPATAIEVSYILKGNGEKLWHKFYGYPKYGVSYFFMDMGNREILGYSHAIYPFINLPIYSPSKNLNLGFMVGSGIGYVSKTYHRTQNFKNTAISSHLNAFINLGATLSYCVNNHVTLNASFNLVHFSNGSYKKPNSGLNYTLMSVGANYTLNNLKTPKSTKYPFINENHRLMLLGIASQKEVKGTGGPKYFVSSFSVEYSYPIKKLWRAGVAGDFMYDTSNKYILDYQQVDWKAPWQAAKGGLTINTELVLNRLSAVFALGGYVYNLDSSDGKFYQRVGLRYRPANRIFLHLALKTHWTIADYLELGVGFKIL